MAEEYVWKIVYKIAGKIYETEKRGETEEGVLESLSAERDGRVDDIQVISIECLRKAIPKGNLFYDGLSLFEKACAIVRNEDENEGETD